MCIIAPKIILLNGTSSSGKTSIGKELCKRLKNYFYVSLDNFDCLIESMENRRTRKLIQADTEILFHNFLKTLTDNNINLIVDHVLIHKNHKNDFIKHFSSIPVCYVAVKCPIEVLIKREMLRKDRHPGLAEDQFNLVHKDLTYNLEIDTSLHTPKEIAESLENAIFSNSPSTEIPELRL